MLASRPSTGHLTSTTISSPTGIFPPGSQVARAPSFGSLRVLALSQHLAPLAHLQSFKLPCGGALCSCSPSVVAPRLGALQLHAHPFIAVPRVHAYPLVAPSASSWPCLTVVFRTCALSFRTSTVRPGQGRCGAHSWQCSISPLVRLRQHLRI